MPRTLARIWPWLLGFLLLAGPAHAATNLIANPSLETGTTAPTSWVHGKWGTLTAAFAWVSGGAQAGTHSAKVTVSGWKSGDAKWYFTPVAVTASTSYTFSNWYKSSVATEVVVELQDAAGGLQYVSLGTPAISSTAWKAFSGTFSTLASTTKLTVYHLVKSNGWLQVDNTSVTANAPPPPGNLIANASVETPSSGEPTRPSQWASGNWGTNTTVFTYVNGDAHTGTRSVKVQMTARTDGDAKWVWTAVPVNGGGFYEFSDWYKSSVDTHPIVMLSDAAGVVTYLDLKDAPASATWRQYRTKFRVPAATSTVQIGHVLSAVGWVQADDFSFAPTTVQGFTRGLVSLTFDDGWQSIYLNALPLLNKYSFMSTQYIISGDVDTPDYMTKAQVGAFLTAGHELAAHTVTHPDLTTLSASAVASELSVCKQWLLTNFGVTAQSLATPYGAYNTAVLAQIAQYYPAHRSVDRGVNAKDDFDAMNLKVHHIDSATTLQQYNEWLNEAAQYKLWVVLVYHQVDTSGSEYSVTPANLDAQLASVAGSGVAVRTVAAALTEVLAQSPVKLP